MESAAMVEFGNQNAQSLRGFAVPREKKPSRTRKEAFAGVANFARDIPVKIQTRSHGTADKNLQLRSPLKALLRPETAMRPQRKVATRNCPCNETQRAL